MSDFGTHFFLCNIFICGIIALFLMIKQVLKTCLTSRMQYNLWFLLLGLFITPFIPFRLIGFLQIFSWFAALKDTVAFNMDTMKDTAASLTIPGTIREIDDFALSVSSKTPSVVGLILCWIWLIGVTAMLLSVMKSNFRFNKIKKSALPLQNQTVRRLYNNCLTELKIKRNIPVFSTVFLKSPVIVGLFRPCIYLPIHLISDFNATDMRYILLHELQHYRYKDALASYLMNLVRILYWCNPFVWFALKEMRNDREIACDTSVLELLNESDYKNYGSTLIHFAEKISLTPFPFTAGMSGSMRQMRQRIINISSYKKPSSYMKFKGCASFAVTGAILFAFVPFLSVYAAEQNRYNWQISSEKVSTIDLSAFFDGYEGSFVLYDLRNDAWSIYDMDRATLRTAPDSTYKIYGALLGLEEGIITPNNSFMAWDGTDYPFETWNTNQDLSSAMESSVNWYFQEIDRQLGTSVIQSYVKKIRYGNETINANRSAYWLQSSLKISPIEQVELLTHLYNNDFGFIPENVNAVKDSICLFSSEAESLYGKTGTGRVDNQDVNGWFIGYVEAYNNTYLFATNIRNHCNATGSKAAEITKSILSYFILQ